MSATPTQSTMPLLVDCYFPFVITSAASFPFPFFACCMAYVERLTHITFIAHVERDEFFFFFFYIFFLNRHTQQGAMAYIDINAEETQFCEEQRWGINGNKKRFYSFNMAKPQLLFMLSWAVLYTCAIPH